MAESFDPYYKWLAIPPEDQPPSHYRLLAIESGEQDDEVIDNAADQRISHLRILEMGEQGEAATALIKEIQVARDCLLDAEKRAAYEAEYEEDAVDAVVDTPFAADSIPSSVGDAVADPLNRSIAAKKTDGSRKKKSKAANKKAKKISLIGHILAPLVGLALGGIVLFVIKSMPSEKEDPSRIDFEIGSMRQNDGQDGKSPELDAETEAAVSPDASGGQLLRDEADFVESPPDIIDEDESPAVAETIVEDAIVTEKNPVIDSDLLEGILPEDDPVEIAAQVDESVEENAEPSIENTEVAPAEDPAINEQADLIDAQRREQEAALVAAIDNGDLMLQLKIAAAIATLEDNDHWDRQVELFEKYKQRASQADDRAIVRAAIFLSQQARDRGGEEAARMLAIEALRVARRDGSPALVRRVTAYILQSSFAESE